MPVQRQSFPGSSALSSATYDDETRTLTVSFKGGAATYSYPNVPPDLWEQLQSADSPGAFWRENIKGQF